LSALLSKHEQKHETHERKHAELDLKIEKTDKSCETRFTKLEGEMDRHSEEQGNRWNEINRTLGSVLGKIEAKMK
jgi:hypothetical protein